MTKYRAGVVGLSMDNENHCRYSILAAMGSVLHYQEDKTDWQLCGMEGKGDLGSQSNGLSEK